MHCIQNHLSSRYNFRVTKCFYHLSASGGSGLGGSLVVGFRVVFLAVRDIVVSIPWKFLKSAQWSWLAILLAFTVSFHENPFLVSTHAFWSLVLSLVVSSAKIHNSGCY